MKSKQKPVVVTSLVEDFENTKHEKAVEFRRLKRELKQMRYEQDPNGSDIDLIDAIDIT